MKVLRNAVASPHYSLFSLMNNDMDITWKLTSGLIRG